MVELELKVDTDVHKSKGESIKEAFENLEPDTMKSGGVLTATREGNSAEKLIYPHQYRRMRNNETARELLEKNFNMLI